MKSWLAIDGGVKECAVARFPDGHLEGVYFARSNQFTPHDVHAHGAEAIVVERPVIRGNATPDPQTIVDLAWSSAALAYSYGVPVVPVTPHQWKGEVPKPVHHTRVLGLVQAMTMAEWDLLERCVPGWRDRVVKATHKCATDRGKRPGAAYYGSWTGHNLLDAVCLGLWFRDAALRGA